MKNDLSEHWRTIERLFAEAVDLPESARARFVASCADDSAVRHELTRLLAAHDGASGFLDEMDAAGAAALLETTEEGTHVGPYRVIRPLGRGGMGIVYLAHDPRLDRRVAVKLLLPRSGADESARRRFMDEARAASALDHPHIGTIYDIGEVDGGRIYIAMAFYEGGTLQDRIAGTPLPVDEATDLARQIAEGLSAAHSRGIIHRDIKPANVIVTSEGVAKIVDFGVAKMTGSEQTGVGIRLGTVAYMSPEQTRGEAVDHRTDIWSLGVVLCEMLTSRRPFRSDSEQAVIFAIRNDDPPEIRALRPDVPDRIARVVERCLQKDPASRYDSAHALLAALGSAAGRLWVDHPVVDEEREGIVVLPFTNMSPDPENEYFSDGLTEEVIADLSHFKALRVIPRTSSMRLKATEKDLRTIVAELGVRYVLEGSVRKTGQALRISVQLIDARQDVHVWADRFDGMVDGVFEIQERVARAVAHALRIRLSAGEVRALLDRPIRDARAFESYLRARYETYRFSPDALERARRHIESALEIVGDNELLYSTLGHIHAMYVEVGLDLDAAALERVDALAEKVFALNPRSARGHWLTAFTAFFRGDLRAAIDASEQALAFDPDETDTLILLGYIYAHAGRNADALACFDRAQELDPLTPLVQAVPGFVAVMEGRFADAVEPYRHYHEMEPDSPFGMVFYGWALAYDRRSAEAVALLHAAAERFPETVFASYARSFAHALLGESDEAVGAITPAFESAARGSEMFARELAHCYALAGRTDKALDWLEHEVRLGMLNYPFLAEHDWFLDSLRGEPRFDALLARVAAASRELAIADGEAPLF